MNDKQFDPLDIRFRQAAEQFEPPYDPEDWNAMERLLDGKKKRRPFAFWWITDVMMLGLLSVILLKVSTHTLSSGTVQEGKTAGTTEPVTAVLSRQQTSLPPAAGQTTQTGEKQNTNAAPVEAPGQNEDGSVPFARPGNNQAKLVAAVKNKSRQQPTGYKHSTLSKAGKAPRYIQPVNNPNETSNVSLEHAPRPASIQPPAAAIRPEQETLKTLPLTTIDSSRIPENPASPNKADDNGAEKDSTTAPLAEKKQDSVLPVKQGQEPNAAAGRGFFATLLYGQEKSGVKQANPGPWGGLYGAMAGYRFNEKWSIRTGIQATDKNYSGGGGVYKLPPGSYYREITNFNAICNILEIPLMLGYRFGLKKLSAWSVSAGPVTSIMKGEEYHYHYLNNAGGTGYGKKYYNTGNVEWFSGFRISPAYERFLGKRFAISAEPFFQFPVSGIGEGSVKLYSFGLQLTTSIHFGPLTKK